MSQSISIYLHNILIMGLKVVQIYNNMVYKNFYHFLENISPAKHIFFEIFQKFLKIFERFLTLVPFAAVRARMPQNIPRTVAPFHYTLSMSQKSAFSETFH